MGKGGVRRSADAKQETEIWREEDKNLLPDILLYDSWKLFCSRAASFINHFSSTHKATLGLPCRAHTENKVPTVDSSMRSMY